MNDKMDYIQEHKELAQKLASKYALTNYQLGTKVDQAEKERYFQEYFEQYNELEKALAEQEEVITRKAIEDGKVDVLDLERELAYVSRRQLEEYRNLYKVQ